MWLQGNRPPPHHRCARASKLICRFYGTAHIHTMMILAPSTHPSLDSRSFEQHYFRGYLSPCSTWGPQTPGPSDSPIFQNPDTHHTGASINSMYQQFSASTPTDYGQTIINASIAGPSTVAPHATTTTTATTQPTAVTIGVAPGSNTGTNTASHHQKPQPLVATGDWANELVQLAKTAELK